MTDSKPHHFEILLGLTAIAAGAVDIISFTKLGALFASAMTGNLAFLALDLARGAMSQAAGPAIALIGFVIGGAFGTLLTRGNADRRILRILLLTETIFLLAASLIWFSKPYRHGLLADDGLVLILASAMGMQGIIGKK